ncbi:similar to Saccharomyces cerevisiae YLR436C ECM30 Putative protein of unknown function [Maudiozyma barnettii]|uniref:Uncharacterized protein n=1 Tax=Maudiozyma barnettii TaxID=61262 RepID=A0A8H2ZI57_9SACH|nr:Ecm30p [Kazachstania barnettii]CAB4256524.1 similar to Saccharomyces cerevisiae YLR436C ECM30 Putative protein of unknown function [Kazachstania barnettii]CAD1785127.1 similar to Saccharomyces cerevisiae YLR436C ECM30 Putative protein of unknown function [Kazachstania barnettii]
MGNTDSKITNVYRDYLFQLSQNDDTSNNEFYTDFLNVTANLQLHTFNTVITNSVLRKIICLNPQNYVNLLDFTISNFIDLFTNFQQTQSTKRQVNFFFKQVITSIRIITKLTPILYEHIQEGHTILYSNNEKLDLQNFFIRTNLIEYFLQLCFMESFTIQTRTADPGTINLIQWQTGISPNVVPKGLNDSIPTTLQLPYLDSNRLELINLFLTLSSLNLYSNDKHDTPFFVQEMISTRQNRDMLLLLMISILNLYAHYCKTINELKVSTLYENPQKTHISMTTGSTENVMTSGAKDSNEPNKQIVSSQQLIINLKKNLILSSLQWFNLTCSHLSDKSTFLNDFLKNEFQLKLLLSTVVKIFKNPIDLAIDQESNPLSFNSDDSSSNGKNNGSNSNSMGQSKPSNKNYNQLKLKDFTIQLPKLDMIFLQNLILLINLIKFNKTFENYFADKFSNKFLIFVIYYIKYYYNVPQYQSNVIPLCYDMAVFLTDKPLILHKLLQTFKTNYYTNKLPNFFKISNISHIESLTYRDFMIIQLSNLSSNDIKSNLILKSGYFEIIYNILPINAKTISKMSISSSDSNLVQLSSVKNSNSNLTDKLSYNATLALLNLLSKLSNRNFLSSFASSDSAKQSALTSPAIKLDILALFLRSMLIYITTCYQESKNLIFLLTRHYTVLLQIKESINFISTNRNINNMLFLEDLPTNSLSLMDQNFGTSNKSNSDYNYGENENEENDKGSSDSNLEIKDEKLNIQNTLEGENYLIFNKQIKEYSDDDNDVVVDNDPDVDIYDVPDNVGNDYNMGTGNNGSIHKRSNNSRPSFNHVNIHSAKFMSTNLKGNDNSSSAPNTNKEYEIYEHPDYNKQLIMNNIDLYLKLKPKWPIGLTENSKLKSPRRSDFSQLWIGASTLQKLIDITKIFLRQFPDIVKMSKNSDFVDIIKNIEHFESDFDKKIKKNLRKEFCLNEPLEFKFSKKRNLVFNDWLDEIFWSDVFQAHSAPYIDSLSSMADESGNSGTGNVQNKRNDSISSGSNIPLLERWSSHGSQISRTQSNGSSMVNYFAPDNLSSMHTLNEQSETSSPDTVTGVTNAELSASSSVTSSISIPNTTNAQPTHNLSRKSSNASSFLSRFSWTGFNKNENQDNVIREETISVLDGDIGPFVVDEGLFKTNIWVGTNIKLFPITTIKKEEFSFLDMTSSLLKKFRFNSTDNSESNVSNTSRNTNESRQYSPVLSANPFMAFASPKRF